MINAAGLSRLELSDPRRAASVLGPMSTAHAFAIANDSLFCESRGS